MTQGRIAQIINNANICEINNLLSRGHTMEYIAAHLQMDLALERLTGNQVRKCRTNASWAPLEEPCWWLIADDFKKSKMKLW
jgi:hypothetical protein